MSDKVSLTLEKLPSRLDDMTKRAMSSQAYLNTVFLEDYRNAQRNRWMTENESEGSKWKPLNPMYAAYKLRRYGGGIRYKWVGGQPVQGTHFDRAGRRRPWEERGVWPNYPGGGRHMLIGTNDLQTSVIGPGKGFQKVVTEKEITITTTISYARDVARIRPFMKFSRQRRQEWKKKYQHYLFSGLTK